MFEWVLNALLYWLIFSLTILAIFTADTVSTFASLTKLVLIECFLSSKVTPWNSSELQINLLLKKQ